MYGKTTNYTANPQDSKAEQNIKNLANMDKLDIGKEFAK
jgi:hypothetical protein